MIIGWLRGLQISMVANIICFQISTAFLQMVCSRNKLMEYLIMITMKVADLMVWLLTLGMHSKREKIV